MKKIIKHVKLIVPAGNANITPPVGPLISQAGISAKDFCLKFNQLTSCFLFNLPLRVLVKVFDTKSDNFEIVVKGLHSNFFKTRINLLKKQNKEMNIVFFDYMLLVFRFFLLLKTSFFENLLFVSLYSFLRNFFVICNNFL